MHLKIQASKLKEVINAAEGTGQDEGLLQLKDGHILLRTVSPSNVVMFACRIPRSEMEAYDRGDKESVGFWFDELKKFASKSSGVMEMRYDDYKLVCSNSNRTVSLPTINAEDVQGVPDQTPSPPYATTMTGDLDPLFEFIKDAKSIIGAETYTLCGREDGFYLYASSDNSSIDEFVSWDDFDSVQMDKDGANDVSGMMGVVTRMSIDFSSSLSQLGTEGKLQWGNELPMKVVFDRDDDIVASYIQSPRINSDGSGVSIPSDVFKRRS